MIFFRESILCWSRTSSREGKNDEEIRVTGLLERYCERKKNKLKSQRAKIGRGSQRAVIKATYYGTYRRCSKTGNLYAVVDFLDL